MSKSTRSSHHHHAKSTSALSKKEYDILQEELSNSEAFQRNGPQLIEMLNYSPQLRTLRLNPFQIMPVVESRYRTYMANSFLETNRQGSEEEFLNMIIQHFADQVDPQRVLDVLIPLAKSTKVKRDKRVLLWSVGEIMSVMVENRSMSESYVARALIAYSTQFSMDLSHVASKFVRKEEPFQFDYHQILDRSFTRDDLPLLWDQVSTYEPDFMFALSFQAMSLFQQLSKPFGFRFYNVIHYPGVVHGKARRTILMPGETEPPPDKEEEDQEEINRALVQGLLADFPTEDRFNCARDALQSMQAAALGESDTEQVNRNMNAASYCMICVLPANPFLMELYRVSGEKAEEINPEDEKELIIDIKNSPRNERLYQRYGELLEEKNEIAGAAKVYTCLLDLQEEPDPKLKEKIESLYDQKDKEPDPVTSLSEEEQSSE